MTTAWSYCDCGHPMLLHDVEDMDGSNPMCCVDGCDQRGCSPSLADPDAPLTLNHPPTGRTHHDHHDRHHRP